MKKRVFKTFHFIVPKSSKSNEAGFTLIELLVTTAFIGVLAAIAIPQYAHYKALARDQEANMTLKRFATAEEAYFVANSNYIDCDQTNCSTLFPEVGAIPAEVTIQFISGGAFCTATASHSKGTGKIFTWHS